MHGRNVSVSVGLGRRVNGLGLDTQKAFAFAQGGVLRCSRLPRGCKCRTIANAEIDRGALCVTSHLCARSSFVIDAGTGKLGACGLHSRLPHPALKKLVNPNSVGCISMGNSNIVSSCSRMEKINGPDAPRVVCKFNLGTRCGNFCTDVFFRKTNGASILLKKTASRK